MFFRSKRSPAWREAEDRARGVVDVAAAGGVVVEVVRRAERLHEGPGQVGEEAAAIGKRDAAPAEGLDRLVQLVGDVIEGLVPGRAPPLAAATRALADQRRLRPLVVVLESQAGRTLGAEAGADGLVVRIALQPGHPAVLDRHFDRATHRAHAAHAVDRASARGAHTAHVWCHDGTHCSLLPSVRLRSSIPRSVQRPLRQLSGSATASNRGVPGFFDSTIMAFIGRISLSSGFMGFPTPWSRSSRARDSTSPSFGTDHRGHYQNGRAWPQ